MLETNTAIVLASLCATAGAGLGALGAYLKTRGKSGGGNGRDVCKRHEQLRSDVDKLPCAEGRVKQENAEKEIEALFKKSATHAKRIGENAKIVVRVEEAVKGVQSTVSDIQARVLPALATKADITAAIMQARGMD